MANGNGNGNGNIRVFVIAGVIVFALIMGAGVGFAFAGVDMTPFVGAIAAVIGAIAIAIPGILAYLQSKEATREARLARQENAQTNVVLGNVAKQVDGMTTQLVVAEVGKAKAEGETKAAELAVVTAEELAEAQIAPSTVIPEVQPVMVVNEVVPVNVIEKG